VKNLWGIGDACKGNDYSRNERGFEKHRLNADRAIRQRMVDSQENQK
jgi:hypothetical protein